MELDQFYIDVKTDCSYLEKKSNVLRWSLFKNDISARSEIASNEHNRKMETFKSLFFYPFVIH